MAENIPADLRYTESDEWVRRDGENMVSGITAYASEQLGDVVYVQYPEIGRHFDKGEAFGEIESVKAVSDLYMPLTGQVNGVNQEVDADPAVVNEDPYGRGWLISFHPDNPADFDSLLDAAAYEQHIAERS